MPNDPNAQSDQKSEGEPFGGPTIVALHVTSGDYLTYDEYINVEYDKPDLTSDAHLILRCSNSSGHDHSDDHTIPAMLPNGVETFHLTHTADYTGVTIRATIRQNGNEDFKEATNITIRGGMRARQEQEAALPPSLPVTLDSHIEQPIRLYRGRDKVLFGTYDPSVGDRVYVCILYRAGQGDQTLWDAWAESGRTLDVRYAWHVPPVAHRIWDRARHPLFVRLVLTKEGKPVYAKTFSALIVCGRE